MVRAALGEAALQTWPPSNDRLVGEVLSGAAYGRVSEALEDAHLALVEDDANADEEW